MKTVRLSALLLLVCALFVTLSCTSEPTRAIPTPRPVLIQQNGQSCIAWPKEIDVHVGDGIQWFPAISTDSYRIIFSSTNYPISGAATSNGSTNTVVKDPGCPTTGDYYGKCYYKYSVIRSGDSTPCADPGVHIVPNGQALSSGQ